MSDTAINKLLRLQSAMTKKKWILGAAEEGLKKQKEEVDRKRAEFNAALAAYNDFYKQCGGAQ